MDDISRLVALFAPRCSDRSTLDVLARMATDDQLWSGAHDLFDKIRDKTVAAERAGDHRLEAQLLFEEVCAKTFYNLSESSAPFDPDSPYWIVPNALALARVLDVGEDDVIAIVGA